MFLDQSTLKPVLPSHPTALYALAPSLRPFCSSQEGKATGPGVNPEGSAYRREPGAVVDFLQVTTYLPILGLPLMLGVILIRRSLLASFTPLRPGGDRSPPGVSALG